MLVTDFTQLEQLEVRQVLLLDNERPRLHETANVVHDQIVGRFLAQVDAAGLLVLLEPLHDCQRR